MAGLFFRVWMRRWRRVSLPPTQCTTLLPPRRKNAILCILRDEAARKRAVWGEKAAASALKSAIQGPAIAKAVTDKIHSERSRGIYNILLALLQEYLEQFRWSHHDWCFGEMLGVSGYQVRSFF